MKKIEKKEEKKGKREVQIEKGNKSPNWKGKIKVQLKIGTSQMVEMKKNVIPKTTM